MFRERRRGFVIESRTDEPEEGGRNMEERMCENRCRGDR